MRKYPLLLAFVAFQLQAQQTHKHEDSDHSDHLGTVEWPTSASPAAHAHFIRGVLYLHSFHYGEAANAFKEAQKADPGDVMAYWGEAMSHTHPVWNEQDTAAARAALKKLAPTREERLAKARTAEERAWIEAADILYGGDLPKAQRDTLYARAMEKIHRTHPKDPEAATFFALALLGLNQGQRDTVVYARAYRIVDSVFAAHPDHPGAAHYMIHAVDDPDHERLGLDAARRYSSIAPAAGHAQHMTSHIFIALGMWDDMVTANERAQATIPFLSSHVVTWLAYGLMQQGRYREAEQWADSMHAQAERNKSSDSWFGVADISTAWNASTRRWNDRWSKLRADTTNIDATIVMLGAGLGAIGRGDRAVADSMLAGITALRVAERARLDTLRNPQPWDITWYGIVRVRENTLAALILRSQGQRERAIDLLRTAAAIDDSLPVEFGPPNSYKPPHEAEGEILLELKRYADAERQFRLALARTPRRPAAMTGLARATKAQGKSREARALYSELAGIWKRADPGIPEVDEARAGSK